MSDHSGGTKGGGAPPLVNQSRNPGQETMRSAWAGSGGPGGNKPTQRTFAQIIKDENSNRNILEIQLVKIMREVDGMQTRLSEF